VGNLAPDRGLPLVTAFSWDTGVQVTTGWRAVEVTAAITNGSATNPRVRDDNDGKQLSGRVTVRPTLGLIVGGSFSRGQFGQRSIIELTAPPDDRDFTQTAYGADVEYSRDHWLVRGDAVLSEFVIPALRAPFISDPLRALALSVEGRYVIGPGLFVAARAEHLAFSRIRGTFGVAEWDAPVTRVEAGGGYYLQRNLVARMTVQVNRREGGRVRNSTLPAVQLLYWF
jgi:hypothetical protein